MTTHITREDEESCDNCWKQGVKLAPLTDYPLDDSKWCEECLDNYEPPEQGIDYALPFADNN